ncbi:unnamed protein product [Rhizophagus irregularis]|nr:unnamed protein product [Rhizophagus irregularis]
MSFFFISLSRFFGISALQFEGPGSFFNNFGALAIQFHISVLRSQFFLRLLRHFGISVSHTEKGERK